MLDHWLVVQHFGWPQASDLALDWLMMLMMSSHTIYMLLDNNIERVPLSQYWLCGYAIMRDSRNLSEGTFHRLVYGCFSSWQILRGDYPLRCCPFSCSWRFQGEKLLWGKKAFCPPMILSFSKVNARSTITRTTIRAQMVFWPSFASLGTNRTTFFSPNALLKFSLLFARPRAGCKKQIRCVLFCLEGNLRGHCKQAQSRFRRLSPPLLSSLCMFSS